MNFEDTCIGFRVNVIALFLFAFANTFLPTETVGFVLDSTGNTCLITVGTTGAACASSAGAFIISSNSLSIFSCLISLGRGRLNRLLALVIALLAD